MTDAKRKTSHAEDPELSADGAPARAQPPADGSLREDTAAGSSQQSEAPSGEAARAVSYELVHRGDPQRLDHFLCAQLPGRTRAFVQRLIEEGRVTVSSTRDPRPSSKVRREVVVKVVIPPPRKVDLSPQDIPIEILYEDGDLAVIVKPAGLTVHPAPNQVGHTLVNALLFRLQDLSGIGGEERPGIVHRLDKETSGVLLVAKNDSAHHGLATQFKERRVHKTYIAVVRGKPRDWEGRIDANIGRSYEHSKKQVIRRDGSGRSAITDYRVLEMYDDFALVEVYPLTGRTHQIRVHLASLQTPVACDKLYGREKAIFEADLENRRRQVGQPPLIERHALHAAGICFRHPLTQEELVFAAQLPDDMHQLRKGLERHRAFR